MGKHNSTKKLIELITSKGLAIQAFFVIDGSVFFVEILIIKTGQTFLLYIPSKYRFDASADYPCYKLKYVNFSENTDKGYDHVQDMYENVHISPDKNDKIEEKLEDGYKHEIFISDISKDDTQELKLLNKQISRLKFCVQNLKYKLALLYKNYICCIRRDDSISTFAIKNYDRNKEKRLCVVIDLEMFYEKGDIVVEDIDKIREGVYKILDKNQKVHSEFIEKIIKNRGDMANVSTKVESDRKKYDAYMTKLENLLKVLNEAEEWFYNQEAHVSRDEKGVFNKSILNSEIDNINRLKEQVIQLITQIRERNDTSILSIDQIMFDNTVMFDRMLSNFNTLNGLS